MELLPKSICSCGGLNEKLSHGVLIGEIHNISETTSPTNGFSNLFLEVIEADSSHTMMIKLLTAENEVESFIQYVMPYKVVILYEISPLKGSIDAYVT